MDDVNTGKIIEELRRQTRVNIRTNAVVTVFFVALLVVGMVVSIKARAKAAQQKTDTAVWTQINDANNRHDTGEVIRLLDDLLKKHPDDYYLHASIGHSYVQVRELEKARKHLEVSYKLFPLKSTRETLDAVNAALRGR